MEIEGYTGPRGEQKNMKTIKEFEFVKGIKYLRKKDVLGLINELKDEMDNNKTCSCFGLNILKARIEG